MINYKDDVIPLPAVAEALESALGNLSGGDNGFALSLLTKYKKVLVAGGTFSPNQEKWLRIMANKATNGGIVPNVGDFSAIYELFNNAKKHLKWPAIKLFAIDKPVKLYLSGHGSAVPGVVNVTNGKKYGDPENKWYGRVYADGKFDQSKKHPDADVLALLEALAKNPAMVAGVHGKLTGQCCFCGLSLEDPKSVAVGYGPVCADHYGLPWGDNGIGIITATQKKVYKAVTVPAYAAVPAGSSGTPIGGADPEPQEAPRRKKILF